MLAPPRRPAPPAVSAQCCRNSFPQFPRGLHVVTKAAMPRQRQAGCCPWAPALPPPGPSSGPSDSAGERAQSERTSSPTPSSSTASASAASGPAAPAAAAAAAPSGSSYLQQRRWAAQEQEAAGLVRNQPDPCLQHAVHNSCPRNSCHGRAGPTHSMMFMRSRPRGAAAWRPACSGMHCAPLLPQPFKASCTGPARSTGPSLGQLLGDRGREGRRRQAVHAQPLLLLVGLGEVGVAPALEAPHQRVLPPAPRQRSRRRAGVGQQAGSAWRRGGSHERREGCGGGEAESARGGGCAAACAADTPLLCPRHRAPRRHCSARGWQGGRPPACLG